MGRKLNSQLAAEVEELTRKLEVAEASLAVRIEEQDKLSDRCFELQQEMKIIQSSRHNEVEVAHDMLDAVLGSLPSVRHLDGHRIIGPGGMHTIHTSPERPSLPARLAYMIKVVEFPQVVNIEGDPSFENHQY